ncbi:MAG: SulP family inorganic anion transporter [Bacteroidetes bacterium]|nr:SulP family inorganic anion transporter [Bacteroidota bacterium]
MEKVQLPKTGLAALKAHFKDDFISGFSVSLIALPLCIGIALASGFPPLAGLITAIVGGIFASRLAGSFVTISGPAAGLIVISYSAIESLGGAGADHGFAGYPHALGAIIIAGAIITLLGLLKVGKVGDYFPSAAVHGMLAAIGIIIMIKQFFPAIGLATPKKEIIETVGEIPAALSEANIYAIVIALLALAILVIHQMVKIKLVKMIPAPMWVLIIIVPVARYMGTDHLLFVDMPDHLFGADGIQFPSFEKIGMGAFWIAVTGFTLVSAIESLLSAKAVDSLDPYKRCANLDKDLVAMGSGSSLAAAIGGLPMISEIVRSSANINNGGKTQWANFYHGALLLVYVLILSFAIELIPTAALAAMLVFTGFRLAHPREFKHTAEIGLSELVVFLITLIGVLVTDLLIGIGIGILANYIFIFAKGASLKNTFSVDSITNGDTVSLKGTLFFSNYLSLKKRLDKAIAGNKVHLDFSEVTLVDHTVVHHLETYRKLLKRDGIHLEYRNMTHLVGVSEHAMAEKRSGIERKAVSKQLSRRQTDLLSLAASQGWNYTLKQDWNGAWDFYTITLRKQIVSLENLVINSNPFISYTTADITTQEGARTTTEFQTLTALKISGLKPLPKFYMSEETFVDKLTSMVSGDDINFDSNPAFSKNYLLKGEDAQAVRALFTKDVLEFFESNKDLCLISNGENILLRSHFRFLKPDEIVRLNQKAAALVKILEDQKQ